MAQNTPAVLGPVGSSVRPYATSVTWRNAEGGSWQQWHDDDDPMPAEWGDRPPDEVVHVYTAAQVAELLAAERERCAKLCEEVHADTSECPELALHCAARIRGA